MITPADDFDDGPDLDPDDPLTVVLRPASGHLGPPPGRYEEIRRGAARRRLVRVAAGVGATCAVAALAVLLPLRLTGSDAPAGPAVPLAPPPASGPSNGPSTVPSTGPAPTPPAGTEGFTRAPTPDPSEGVDTTVPAPGSSTAPTGTVAPTFAETPSGEPTQTARDTTSTQPGTPSAEPSTPSSTP
ncbi:hypothetical protein OG352_31085 [Streptomyces sp. NBC_01485]|uniref:hypothetical protein n=1 Tax=Streptomyces sp. NBC_01485 TaxID=2903884 RepID=UPI002E2F232A|nr:hypothetical protein [Streptomyces sp. NBC_01485]